MVSEVYNMDCMEYMRSIPDKFFELAVVDPPYGINAPNMTMGTNLNRKYGGYNGQSVAQRLKKGRLNSGAGKLKNRVLNTMACDWDYSPPSQRYFDELFRVSLYQDYGDEEVYLDGFVDCAEWRINSIWHDASEPPITGKEALVKYMTGDLKIKYRVDVFCGNEWKEMCHYDKLLQFAYIEDLIPNTED